MPDSLSSQELRNLKALYPSSPYMTRPYQYSYFMGNAASRDLVQGSTYPKLRLRRHEKVSQAQPYAVYDDVELGPRAPGNDGWPFQTYYYLMDYDAKGQVVVKPGQTVMVPASSIRARGSYINTGKKVAVQAQLPSTPAPAPRSTNTYISLEGWW